MRALILAAFALLLAPAGAAASSRVAIFYYPWYSTPAHDGGYAHWQQDGHAPPNDLASTFYPLRGAYSSADPAVLDEQMREIAGAGIGQIITSWWGRGSVEDARLPSVLAAAHAHGLDVTAHLEPYSGRTAASTAQDIAYLRTLGMRDFYVYDSLEVPDADWAVMNKLLGGVRVFAQTSLVGRAAAGGFAGIYTYDVLSYSGGSFVRVCAEAHRRGLLCAPSVGPGYDARRATGDPRVRPRRAGATYDAMWRNAVRAEADIVTITSYNEWHEGTQIEPARWAGARHGFRYATYEGAYGLTGEDAAWAYLGRTAVWSAFFAESARLSTDWRRGVAGSVR